MSALIFTLRQPPPVRVDLAALVPARLDGVPAREISAWPVGPARLGLHVGDLFRVRGSDAADIRFDGGSPLLDRVGEGMAAGTIRVSGDVGGVLGRGMTGGRVIVEGRAGPHAGSGMAGGRIEILGDAGDRLGGPLPGEMAGMKGGVLIVRGGTGARAGDRLRRGLITVGGDAGDFAGSRMIAGTLVIQGRAGRAPGTLMRRGTIVLGQVPASLAPSFVRGAVPDGVFLSLLARWLAEEGAARRGLLSAAVARYVGDNAVLGLGEVFVATR